MSLFGNHLCDLLASKGLSQSEFARMVGGSQSHVSMVISGASRPPKDRARIETWADALGLAGEEREQFLLDADLSRAPASIQRAVTAVHEPEISYVVGTMNDLGDCLARHMQAAGASVEALASAIGADPDLVDRYLTGAVIAASDVDAIARALHLADLDKLEFQHLAEIWRTVPHDGARDQFVRILRQLLENERRIRAIRSGPDPGRHMQQLS